MNDLTISDIREEKEKLELLINDSIAEFYEKTDEIFLIKEIEMYHNFIPSQFINETYKILKSKNSTSFGSFKATVKLENKI